MKAADLRGMPDAPLTRAEIERLLELCEKATCEPWTNDGSIPAKSRTIHARSRCAMAYDRRF